MNFGLEEDVISLLKGCFKQYPEIEKVKVYGSRAKGSYDKGSDIDLAFFSAQGKDLAARLKSALEELPTPYMFDVTDYNCINNPDLKEHIDRVGKLIYSSRGGA